MQSEEYERLFENEDHYWWYVARRRLALRLLRAARPEGPILDLGCGTGAVLSEIVLSCEALGLDASARALEFCARRGLAGVVLGDAERLPLATGAFAAVVALDLFEHVPDDRAALAEAYRALRPGGALVLSVPAFRWLWGPHDVALMHRRRYTRAEVRRALLAVGFSVERINYGIFLLFPAVVAVRLLDKLRRGPARVSLPVVPRWLNRALIRLQDFEGALLRTLPLPWGSSVVAVARKPLGGC
jgi:SAM-dependent methyltransferase